MNRDAILKELERLEALIDEAAAEGDWYLENFLSAKHEILVNELANPSCE